MLLCYDVAKIVKRERKMNNLLGIIVSYVAIGVVIVTAKWFERFGEEASRKYIHIVLCNWWWIAMYFFDHVIWASIVPLSFVVINYISYKKDLIKVMERQKQDGLGTVYYAISLLILTIISFGIFHDPKIGLIGCLVMGYGDGLAAVIGKKIKSKEYKVGDTKKSIAGSITMLCITFIILSIALFETPLWGIKAILASIVITIVEAVSIKGTDNLTVPILTSGIMILLKMI